jgi:hypothetical protein
MPLTIKEIAEYIIPDAKAHAVEASGGDEKHFGCKMKFLVMDPDELYVHIGLDTPTISDTLNVRIPPEDVASLLDESLSVDAYMQGPEFRNPIEQNISLLCQKAYAPGVALKVNVEWSAYVPQKALKLTIENIDLYSVMRSARLPSDNVEVPQEYVLSWDQAFIPPAKQARLLGFHIFNRDPVICVSGPTGSGKTQLGYYIAATLAGKGFAGMAVDATTHIEIDELFDYVDITSEDGVKTGLGTLCTFARDTKEKGLQGIVVINEFNAFKDETRRAFYPLFDVAIRRHIVQDAKGGKHLDPVDFEHITFILTTNPTNVQYLTEDIKAFSNAEVRRMAFLELPYETEKTKIREILSSIISHKPAYQETNKAYMAKATGKKATPLLDKLNWDLATDLFMQLNTKEGLPVNYDVGYTVVANLLWMGTVLATHSKSGMSVAEAMAQAMETYLITGIQDESVKDIMRQRAANCGIRT